MRKSGYQPEISRLHHTHTHTHTHTMKSYITITYTTGIYERSDSFIRARFCKKPTYIGAARMIAKHLGCLPSDVSVIRVELIGYAA